MMASSRTALHLLGQDLGGVGQRQISGRAAMRATISA
jgi:hypothetical protein